MGNISLVGGNGPISLGTQMWGAFGSCNRDDCTVTALQVCEYFPAVRMRR